MTTTEARALSPAELGAVIRLMREIRKWSQETLATLAGLTPRTVQRVEAGGPSSTDTRRALAVAFDSEDIDLFNKAFTIPDPEALKAQQEEFEKNHVSLASQIVSTGKILATLAETTEADISTEAVEMERQAAGEFAALIDLMRDYRDCAELYSQVVKLDIHADFQNTLDTLASLDVSVCSATRKVRMRTRPDDPEGMVWTILYLVAFPKGQEPKELVVVKAISM